MSKRAMITLKLQKYMVLNNGYILVSYFKIKILIKVFNMYYKYSDYILAAGVVPNPYIFIFKLPNLLYV